MRNRRAGHPVRAPIAAAQHNRTGQHRRQQTRRDIPAAERTANAVKRGGGQHGQQRIAGRAALAQHDDHHRHHGRNQAEELEKDVSVVAHAHHAHHAQADDDHARDVVMHAGAQPSLDRAEAERPQIGGVNRAAPRAEQKRPAEYIGEDRAQYAHRRHQHFALALPSLGNRRINAEEHHRVAMPRSHVLARKAEANRKRHQNPEIQHKERHHVRPRRFERSCAPLQAQQAQRRTPRNDDIAVQQAHRLAIPRRNGVIPERRV